MTPHSPTHLVLDTNVVLALWLFADPQLEHARRCISSGVWRWVATATMATELAHVRQRPFPSRYQARLELWKPPALWLEAPVDHAPWRCRDRSDQVYLDLAWQHRLPLWTRDRDLLTLRKRASHHGLIIETPEAGIKRLCQPLCAPMPAGPDG